MNILIIGSGGREHTIGWKLRQSSNNVNLFFLPGNGGTEGLGKNIDLKVTDIDAIASFVVENKIQYTIVGPEDPLSLGIVDLFERKGLGIFGPTKKAARLETSKAWAGEFMKKYHIPNPATHIFKEYKKAILFFRSHEAKEYVIKASGLALGKGVILPESENEAMDALNRIMVQKEFGEAGREVVVQERLIGREVSILALSDGKTIIPFLSAQDHKRIFDNDSGPNTGGMGVYAPVPFVSKGLIKKIHETILKPTIDGMRKEGFPFKGILFAGLMVTDSGAQVLEYNVRFGDPETQALMVLLRSPLLPLLIASTKGTLKTKRVMFHKKSSVCVVLASPGYPGKYSKGIPINGLEKKLKNSTHVFHAGTRKEKGVMVTSGGRVLGVVSVAQTIRKAMDEAYDVIGNKGISFKGMQYRRDIGTKGILKHKNTKI